MIDLFLLGLALAASPGPDFFLILRHTLVHGRGIGYMTLAGNRVSLCFHMSFAILGLSAILATSPSAFSAVRLLGAAYLIYLGATSLIGRFRGERRAQPEARAEPITPGQAFRRGFLNNLLNPKVSLFFLSLFPQFASPGTLEQSPLSVALSFFIGNSTWWVPLVAVVSFPTLRAAILRFQRVIDPLFAALFVGFGLRIVLETSASWW